MFFLRSVLEICNFVVIIIIIVMIYRYNVELLKYYDLGLNKFSTNGLRLTFMLGITWLFFFLSVIPPVNIGFIHKNYMQNVLISLQILIVC